MPITKDFLSATPVNELVLGGGVRWTHSPMDHSILAILRTPQSHQRVKLERRKRGDPAVALTEMLDSGDDDVTFSLDTLPDTSSSPTRSAGTAQCRTWTREQSDEKPHIILTGGGVWRYERPTEESDEEITDLDDEEPMKETQRERRGG
ncbi:peroxisome proliferator-activated receptor gamma coactivator-related protein 1-like protein, partial [Lates japonicus]